MKFFISILCAFLLSISLHAETYLSSRLNSSGYERNKTISVNDILIIESINIYIYENGVLLNYFNKSMFNDIDETASLYSFKYDKLNRRLVFCSDSGLVTYNIDTEEVKLIKTGFPVYFFDVYNSVALISNGDDFVWWDLDKGLIKREKKGITDEIMFRMIDTERFILYHSQAAYLYSKGNYEKLFEGVPLLIHRYEEMQIYKDFLLYKPADSCTVVFNMQTKKKIAELDNSNSWDNLLAFHDDVVYYSNNDLNLVAFNLNTLTNYIYEDIKASYLFGKNGKIFYQYKDQIFNFDPGTGTSEQIVRRITDLRGVKLEVLGDHFVILNYYQNNGYYLEILDKKGHTVFDYFVDLANPKSYALRGTEEIYFQDKNNQLFVLNIIQNSQNLITKLDYQVEQLYYQEGTLYYLYENKLYKYVGNQQFEEFQEFDNCYKVELIEDSCIYFYSRVEDVDDENQIVLSKLDLVSNEVVKNENSISNLSSYKRTFIKQNDTLYQREFTKFSYISPSTLKTVRYKLWSDGQGFVDLEAYQNDILLCYKAKIKSLTGKVEDIFYKQKHTTAVSNLVNIAIDDNRCYMLDNRGIIYYEDITPTGVWEDREEVPSIDLANYITVYDIQGKKIGEFASYSVCIDNLQRGKYILEYTVAKKKYFKQIIRL